MRNILLITVLAALLMSCSRSGHRKYYKPYPEAAKGAELQFLPQREQPLVYSSDNLDRDVRIMSSRGFRPIGESSFNGQIEGEQHVAEQARRVGAKVVLVQSAFTNTQTNIVPFVVPTQSTSYGQYGTVTTYGSAVVPVASQQQRFDQTAVYFAKDTKKWKFGVALVNLTPELRAAIQRNTGALIDVVREDSPAFNANLFFGDVLIRVNGTDVRNVEHALELMKEVSEPGVCPLTILRKGEEKVVNVQLGAS